MIPPVKVQESENGKYRITIKYDEDSLCPIIGWDLAACYLFEYNDRRGSSHRLHNKCSWRDIWDPKYYDNDHSLEDALTVLIRRHVEQKEVVKYINTSDNDYRMIYDRSERIWHFQHYWKSQDKWYDCFDADLKSGDYIDDMLEYLDKDDMIAILDKFGEDIVVKDFSLTGDCQGDYIEGVAYCTKERFKKMVDGNIKDWETRIDKLIDSEVECINRWMWGDVYGYVLEERVDFTKTYEGGIQVEDYEWNEIDSCWDIFQDPDDIIKEHLPQVAAA